MRRYKPLLDKQPSFGSVLLFQLALPSEIPGYLLGLARYPLPRYLAALMLAELPYAVGTVLLGIGFVNRDTTTLVAVCIVGDWPSCSLRARCNGGSARRNRRPSTTATL